jgi:hypothetical protein
LISHKRNVLAKLDHIRLLVGLIQVKFPKPKVDKGEYGNNTFRDREGCELLKMNLLIWVFELIYNKLCSKEN